MSRNEFGIKQLFTKDTELPEIVQLKKQEAYNLIYAQEPIKKSAQKARTSFQSSRVHNWSLPKAAAIFLACLLAAGSTVAAASLLTRWERLKNMDQDTVEQYYEEGQLGGHLSFQSTRPFTEQEQHRYQELEKAYQNDTYLPHTEITRLQEGETYSGEGVCLFITDAGEENILYLPETELSDEELLEIIEYLAKQDYALYETNRLQALEKGNWESRLAAMTDEEVDYYYLAFWTNKFDVSNGYCRGLLSSLENDTVLTASETARYETLETAYEQNNLFPIGEAVLIESPEEYSGSGIAFCRYDGNFYLPSDELTDEELLQIIDFRQRSFYAKSRIDQEIKIGYRQERPKPANHITPEITVMAKPFADTEGSGSVKSISDAKIGDIVLFGSYEQDYDVSNGKEDIEWYVLDYTEDSMTLLSVNILDGGTYSKELTHTTWKDSTLRKWLNEHFYETAFTTKEQSGILTTVVENLGGEDTEDKIYLLSYQEFLAYFGVDTGSLTEIESTDDYDLQNLQNYKNLDSRIFAEATEAARANGVWYWTEETTEGFLKFKQIDYSCANGKSSWWLRTTEKDYPVAHTIEAQGPIDSQQYVNIICGIRPVIQIRR